LRVFIKLDSIIILLACLQTFSINSCSLSVCILTFFERIALNIAKSIATPNKIKKIGGYNLKNINQIRTIRTIKALKN
jgi:hypothetical protein